MYEAEVRKVKKLKEIGFRWPVVEANPYIIGDFTWTAWDYIGEAGIKKALYVDYDITGRLFAQGAYRSVVLESDKTYLYSFHPSSFGKSVVMSMWSFPAVIKCWNYKEYENKPVEIIVFLGLKR